MRPAFCAPQPSLRSSWNITRMIIRGRLTDLQIEKYRRAGYYDPAFRAARKERWLKKQEKRTRREGNFDLVEGRMVYRPS